MGALDPPVALPLGCHRLPPAATGCHRLPLVAAATCASPLLCLLPRKAMLEPSDATLEYATVYSLVSWVGGSGFEKPSRWSAGGGLASVNLQQGRVCTSLLGGLPP